MPKQHALTQEEKLYAAREYRARNFTQAQLASQLLVSRRTIQRALLEMGVTTYNEKKPRIVTNEEEQILAQVKRRGLNAGSLERALSSAALTKDNVRIFLSKLTPAEFADTLYVVGYLRVNSLARQHAANQAIHKDKEAANG